MGVLSCFFVVIGAFLALKPSVVHAGGGKTDATVVTTYMTDVIAALATLTITKKVYEPSGIMQNLALYCT